MSDGSLDGRPDTVGDWAADAALNKAADTVVDRAADRVVDTVALRGLRVRGFHGVLPQERRDGQDFVVDAVVETDTRAAAASDDLADTVDYAAMATRLAAVVEGEPLDLIETLAARLADAALTDPRAAAVTVTVHKPQAPVGLPFDDVTVTVRRSR